MAVFALAVACLVIAFARATDPKCLGRKDAVYWWVVAGFGWRSSLYILALYQDLPSGTPGLILAYGPMISAGVAILIQSAKDTPYVSVAGGALALITLLNAAFSLTAGGIFTALLAVALILPAVIQPMHVNLLDIRRGFHHSARILAFTILALLLVRGDSVFGACRIDKCSQFGVQIGEAGTANALGLGAAFVGVLAATTIRDRDRLPFLLAVAVIVDLTASRSAYIPLVLGAGILVAQAISHRLGRMAGLLGILAGSTAVLYVAFLGAWTAATATGRGQLWLRARELAADQPWFGYGPSFWVRQESSTQVVANYSTHNVALEMLVSFGVFGTGLFVLALVAAVTGRVQGSGSTLAVAVAAWLGGSVTEVIGAPGRLYVFPAAFIVIFIIARARSTASVFDEGNLSR